VVQLLHRDIFLVQLALQHDTCGRCEELAHGELHSRSPQHWRLVVVRRSTLRTLAQLGQNGERREVNFTRGQLLFGEDVLLREEDKR
jgi:hypothetical protein